MAGLTRARLALVSGVVALVAVLGLQSLNGQPRPNPLDQPFVGVTNAGTVRTGLFPIRVTGVSTAPVREAAETFLAALTPEQAAETRFAADDIEWRDWHNIHRYQRKGVRFEDMTDAQKEAAFGLLRAGLSVRGFETARDIMRLNYTVAELNGRFGEYGDGLYHLTVMGEPSEREPWGWQLDGHHLAINYFVLGDQVVMTPTFMGSEPISAESGRYAGTVVLQEEQDRGAAFMRSLTPAQQKAAIVQVEKTGNNAVAQAFNDNLVLDFAGVRATALDAAQREALASLIAVYVHHMREGHAKVRMEEVRAHLDETYFAWIGDPSGEGVFYYRVHSPVILIEFDHQLPVALPGPRVPNRRHVHSVVRTPNGNDYGKDLLRQHYERTRADEAHGHGW